MSLETDLGVSPKRIRRLLRRRKVKQRELAEAIGMAEQTLSNKMHGLRTFTLKDLVRIADQLDTSVDYLTGRIEEPQNVR
jgi:transcriptional regulator with XRE-family HTH domain